jgi:hypothetical protein
MSNVTSIAPAGVQAGAARYSASAPTSVKTTTPAQDTAPGVDSAPVRVAVVTSQVAYTASLNSLRNANKTMMGYLLNIQV